MANAVQQIALEEEYKKATGITPQDISTLREWLKTQPHLPRDHLTDLDLILAYHSCRRSTERAKQVIDLHYTLRTLFVNFFKDRSVDMRVENTLNTMLLQPLPTRMRDGSAVLYTRLMDFDSKNYIVPDIIRTTFMILDLWQLEEGTWPGAVLAMDMAGTTMGHVTKWDLQVLQQFTYFLEEAMLVQFKGIHFINATPLMDRIMMILRPFFKKNMSETIFIHQAGSNGFEKYFPIEGLPKEGGGNYKTQRECKDELIKKLKDNQAFFANENKKRVVESLRPGKPKTLTDLFGGIEGSFKKLDID